MSDIKLNFPSGKFTHTELAQHNGKTNQQVWTAYQAAIKDGTIIPAGARPNLSGKGKPSKLWEVNPQKNVTTTPLTLTGSPTPPVVEPVVPKIQSVPRVKREPKVAPVVVQPTENTEKAIEAIVEKKAEVIKPEPEPEVEITSVKPINIRQSQVKEIEEVCPFCHTKLLCVESDGRVKVWCRVNDIKICSSSENPYGVAKNVKEAVKILTEKYFDKK